MSGSVGRKIGSIAIAIIMTSIVVWLTLLDSEQVSPGPLTKVHAQVHGLDTQAGCDTCHGAGNQEMADACNACHFDIGGQLASASGFHGSLENVDVLRCETCHSEHLGRDIDLVSASAFEKSGITPPESYSHDRLDYDLGGRHTTLACKDCHPNANVDVLEEGKKRYLGQVQTCTACHDDPHKTDYGSDCRSCHGEEHPFKKVSAFHHTNDFKLEAAHAEHECKTCHETGSAYSVGNLFQKEIASIRDCNGCHASPHTEIFLAAAASESGTTAGESCVSCHQVVHGAFMGPTATISATAHAAAGFSLDVPHDKAECTACHTEWGKRTEPLPEADLAASYMRLYPGRDPRACAVCHDDPHVGQFRAELVGADGCLSCHQPHTFKDHTFTHDRHVDASFQLEGAHSKMACRKCHLVPEGMGHADNPAMGRVFKDTPSACRACHEDPHIDQFSKEGFAGRGCTDCHSQDVFLPCGISLEMHAETRFPLVDSHQAVGCNDCHGLGPEDGKRVYHGTAIACDQCHEDVHDRTFDRSTYPTEVEGRTGCDRCHTAQTFRDLHRPFDHDSWTTYPLNGAHRKLDCGACHARHTPDPNGRSFAAAKGNRCADCHSDPHVGQFRQRGVTDCARCHSEEGTFKEFAFDHQLDSRFPLDEQHAKLECASCHLEWPLPNGGTVTRYRPLGRTCADCHDPGGAR